MTVQTDSTNWAAKEIVMISESDLIPFERNPRIHSEAQVNAIKNSIQEWGWTAPVVVDESNMVIAGHGRLLAAQELGIMEIPCIVAKGWTDEQKRAYVIADNKIYEKGDWDYGAVFTQMKELASQNFDISLIDSEMNLDNLTFTPEFNPSFSTEIVNESDMQSAQDKIDGDYEGRMQQPDRRDILCPHCGNEFSVDA